MNFLLLIFAGIFCSDVNDDISLTENVGRAYQSMSEIPEPVELKTEIIGTVPKWLFGSLYRNGPGKFEYGNDTFKHLFDPSAMIQRLHFEDGRVFYQRKLIKSTHTLLNMKEKRIVLTEMGTWTEPENTDEIHAEDISKERCKHLLNSFPTDNTVVSVFPIHGWIVAFTESPIITLNDRITLETEHILDIRNAPAFPEGLALTTVLAHGVTDKNGDFWTFATGVWTEQFPFIPKVVYLAVKIANASKLDKSSPEEILENISFSDFLFNSNVRDFKMRYFHSFVQASEDFLILPFTSVEIQPDAILNSCKNGQPPIEMMNFNKNADGFYRIFDKKTMKWLPKEFISETNFQMHPIQGFYDRESEEFVLDTLEIMNHDMIQEKVFSSMISKFSIV
ncbi:unnamed protein product [Oikopleura dioica]|uniref:Uncharacterized protein n=1 Tax=Oikopleura dioica TaxID=34765 RepID=E4YEQ4_OIKDI|nr:unnamed protein product [Oikopleura dioica]